MCGLKKTTMLVLAVTLHNIPEGMAVGVVFAGFLAEKSGITAGIREDEASDGQIPGQLSFDLPGGKEQAALEPAEDPGAVFRPGNAAREDASSGESAAAEDAENGHAKTFVPGATDRENMLRSARENFLNQSGSYSRKNRRRH